MPTSLSAYKNSKKLFSSVHATKYWSNAFNLTHMDNFNHSLEGDTLHGYF